MTILLIDFYFAVSNIANDKIKIYALVCLSLSSIFSTNLITTDKFIGKCDNCFDNSTFGSYKIEILRNIDINNIFQKLRSMLENNKIILSKLHKQ